MMKSGSDGRAREAGDSAGWWQRSSERNGRGASFSDCLFSEEIDVGLKLPVSQSGPVGSGETARYRERRWIFLRLPIFLSADISGLSRPSTRCHETAEVSSLTGSEFFRALGLERSPLLCNFNVFQWYLRETKHVERIHYRERREAKQWKYIFVVVRFILTNTRWF